MKTFQWCSVKWTSHLAISKWERSWIRAAEPG
jgi:hypothetical protein